MVLLSGFQAQSVKHRELLQGRENAVVKAREDQTSVVGSLGTWCGRE